MDAQEGVNGHERIRLYRCWPYISLCIPSDLRVPDPRDRLESWKEIAAFLNRSERTVRRWEEKEGLPVHRLAHDKRASVYAYLWELERWRESRRQLLEAEPSDAAAVPAAGLMGRWRWAIAGIAVIVATSAPAFWWFRPLPTPSTAYKPNPEAVRLAGLANFGANAGRKQIETGIKYYQDASRLDPNYANAWMGLSAAHLVQIWFGETPALEAGARAKKEAQRAIEINPGMGQAVRVLAAVSHYIEWDHVTAEAQMRRAMDLSPRDVVAPDGS